MSKSNQRRTILQILLVYPLESVILQTNRYELLSVDNYTY